MTQDSPRKRAQRFFSAPVPLSATTQFSYRCPCADPRRIAGRPQQIPVFGGTAMRQDWVGRCESRRPVEECRVQPLRLAGQRKAGWPATLSAAIATWKNDASFEIRINFGRSSGLRNSSDWLLSAKIAKKSDWVAARN